MEGFSFGDPVREYKPYKAEQINKKLAKARNLLNSIDATSLRPEDKKALKKQIAEIFNV